MNSNTSELRFLLKHSSIYGTGVILSRAVAFLMLPLYTRHLTLSDYGVLDLVETTTGLVGIVAGLGIVTSISRFYYEYDAEQDRRRLISTIFILIVAFSFVLLVSANLAAPVLARLILNDAKYALYFQVAFAGLLMGILVDVGQSYLRILYKSVLFISLSIASLVVGVALNVVFIAHFHYGVLGILSTSLIVRLLVGIPLTAAILYQTGLRFSRRDAMAVLRYSTPLLPAMMGTAFMNYADRYFVKHYVSIADVGVYGLANKLGGVLHALVTSPFIMTFEARRFHIAKDRPNAPAVFRAVFDGFFFVLLFLSLTLSVFTPEIMVAMTTPPYYRAGPLVPLLLLNMLIFGMKYHVDFGILHSQKTHYYMWVNVMTALVQFASLFLLVRPFGVLGAALASTISVLVNSTLLYLCSRKFYRIDFNFGRCGKLLGLATAVYGCAWYVPATDWLWSIPIKLILLLGFLLVLPLTRIVSSRELSQLRALTLSYVRRPQPAV
jgi:O-antigen/teichoic acid export membrane protein